MDKSKLETILGPLQEIEQHLTECWGTGSPGSQPSYHELLKLRGIIRIIQAIIAGKVA